MALPPGAKLAQQKSEELTQQVGGEATQVTPIVQEQAEDEKLSTEGVTLADRPEAVTPTTIDPAGFQPLTTPEKVVKGQTETIERGLGTVEGQQFTGAKSDFSVSSLVDLDDVSGQQLSDGALATAATQELDERATVKYQLSELFKGIEDGKPLPPWASPAVRKVTSVMQQRGLGASSLAAAAVTQAIMESGISIAAQDAKMYQAIQIKNLDNQQQAALSNAVQIATMDRQNADARTKAAISNAQAILSIDIKELDAQQQSNALKYSAITQAALADAAAENARVQLNAKNELQVEEFFTELGVQIDQQNISRDVALRTFMQDCAISVKSSTRT